MANPFAQLRRFAGTRNGKIAVGVTAVGGVVAAGLLTRHKAGGDPTADGGAAAGATAPSYLQTTGTSGANAGEAPTDNSSGGSSIDPGQLEDLLSALGNATDAFNNSIGQQYSQPAPIPPVPVAITPVPYDPPAITAPVPTYNPPPTPAPAPAPVAAAPPKPVPRTYTVKSGDTLSAIAQRYYGKASQWPTIYNANKGTIGGNPNLIKPGQVLVIP